METDENVISLAQRRSESTPRAMKQLEAYWEGLRNGRIVPGRSEVDPRGLTGSLEFAFVLERIAPGMARFRVAGRALNDLVGIEVRGMPFSTFFEPQDRNEVSDSLEAVFAEPAVVRMDLLSEGGFGRKPLEAQLTLLPLRSDLGDISRALGCLHYNDAVGRQPRRFTITRETRATLIGHGALPAPSPQLSQPAAENSSTAAFAETAGTFAHRQPPGTPQKDRPHLRLVKSD